MNLTACAYCDELHCICDPFDVESLDTEEDSDD